MKKIIRKSLPILLIGIFWSAAVDAQKYRSTSSTVHFYSSAPMEDIEASNTDGKSAMDLSSGEIVYSIPIRSFTFEKSLMQEHFNENYLESDKYPEATFKGSVTGYDPERTDWQPAKASGTMYIHGVEQRISVEGKIQLQGETMAIQAKFPIRLEDYKIKIPKVVFYNIAEVVDVTINFNYEKIN